MDGRKHQPGNACLCIVSKVSSCLCSWTTSTWVGKSRIWNLCGKDLMKHVDLEKPTSFLDQVHLGCTQRECKTEHKSRRRVQKMFESRISAGAAEKLPGSEKSGANAIARPHDIVGYAKKCVERYCELANKTSSSYIRSPHHVLTTISLKKTGPAHADEESSLSAPPLWQPTPFDFVSPLSFSPSDGASLLDTFHRESTLCGTRPSVNNTSTAVAQRTHFSRVYFGSRSSTDALNLCVP